MKMLSIRNKCAIVTASGIITVIAIIIAVYLVSRQSTTYPTLVLVDSDGGVDDLMALLMLLKTDHVEVKTITTVQGNTGVSNATRNIKTLLTMLNKQHSVAVYPGRDKFEVIKEGYYGWDGLGDFLPPAPSLEDNSSAPEMMASIVLQHPGKIILLCLGPLTNVGLALSYLPDILEKVQRTIIVGASYKGGGNVGPGLEFNMATDPSAASLVFKTASHNNPIQLIPLETIETYASFPRSWREDLGNSMRTPMMEFFNKAENQSLYKDKMWTCYDQTGAADIISPNIIINRTFGRLTLDHRGAATFMATPSNDCNVQIVTALNKNSLQNLLIDALSSPGSL